MKNVFKFLGLSALVCCAFDVLALAYLGAGTYLHRLAWYEGKLDCSWLESTKNIFADAKNDFKTYLEVMS